MPRLTIVYWRDIPAQVIAKQGRKTEKRVLHDRFAVAIDKAAMRAGMAGTDAYLEQWRRQEQACGENLRQVVDETCADLEQRYDQDRLDHLVKLGGAESG